MDQAAESIPSAYPIGRRACGDERDGARLGRPQAEGAVGAVRVVVGLVLAEHRFKLVAVNDEDPVEALSAERSHPAFGERVPKIGASD